MFRKPDLDLNLLGYWFEVQVEELFKKNCF